MPNFDGNKVFAGFRLGLFIGALVALFRAPRFPILQRIREASEQDKGIIEALTPPDAVSRGIAEGKEVARRRQAEINNRR